VIPPSRVLNFRIDPSSITKSVPSETAVPVTFMLPFEGQTGPLFGNAVYFRLIVPERSAVAAAPQSMWTVAGALIVVVVVPPPFVVRTSGVPN